MSLLAWLDISLATLLLYLALALLSGYVHGATGMAGGLLLASVLVHWMDIKQVVPLVTCALIFSHSSRIAMYRTAIDWSRVKTVLALGAPMIVAGAVIFDALNRTAVALVFALVLALSFPVKAWAQSRQLRTSRAVLAGAGGGWGILAGMTIGPGFFLAPFLMGTGMNRLAFVGTMACCTLVMNLIKVSAFGTIELLSLPLAVLGLMLGLATVPGNFAGKILLQRISDRSHSRLIDALTVGVIVNFLYIAWAAG